MKKRNSGIDPKTHHKLIELILSCNDCIYTAEELVRMDEKKLMKVRDSLLFELRGKIDKKDGTLFVQETSVLGAINDLFLER